MSDNVGLTTPRGSGTSGYVQKNLSHFRPRDRAKPYNIDDFQRYKQRKPDAGMLEHERRRKIEVKVFELRDQLEEEGVDEEEIDKQTSKLRGKLEKEDFQNKDKVTDARGLKSHQVHDLAKAKIEETEKLRQALGISKDYEEGSHWKRQEERRKKSTLETEEKRPPADDDEYDEYSDRD